MKMPGGQGGLGTKLTCPNIVVATYKITSEFLFRKTK